MKARAEVEIEVRYAETDQMGIVHHANYLVWFEVARTRLCAEGGIPYPQIEALGYYLIITQAQQDYRLAATMATGFGSAAGWTGWPAATCSSATRSTAASSFWPAVIPAISGSSGNRVGPAACPRVCGPPFSSLPIRPAC
jgi:hypothetical protein